MAGTATGTHRRRTSQRGSGGHDSQTTRTRCRQSRSESANDILTKPWVLKTSRRDVHLTDPSGCALGCEPRGRCKGLHPLLATPTSRVSRRAAATAASAAPLHALCSCRFSSLAQQAVPTRTLHGPMARGRTSSEEREREQRVSLAQLSACGVSRERDTRCIYMGRANVGAGP